MKKGLDGVYGTKFNPITKGVSNKMSQDELLIKNANNICPMDILKGLTILLVIIGHVTRIYTNASSIPQLVSTQLLFKHSNK